MRAVPSRIDTLLERLEEARRIRPGAGNALRRLREADREAMPDAERLLRFHEAVLFLRAYPHDRRVRNLSERILRRFEKRVARLAAADEDLSAFDAPEAAGVAGSVLGTDYSFDLARWLAARHPGRVRIDWGAAELGDRMRASWPDFLPLLEEEALADANVPYLAWLGAAAGRRRDDLSWLLARYARLPGRPADRAERFDSMGLPIAWDLGAGNASRTKMRRPGAAPFFHDAPLLARRDVSLDAILSGPRMKIRKLSRREGDRVCDLVREATAARYREFYTFTYADPATVLAARPGRGVELFLVGVRQERRLPLRAAYGGFVVKNSVPIGYIEGLAFLERLEIGFNMYYTFREGESAWIYAQVLKLHRDALGVTSFSIDPYQLGYENPEAIESGAFWFYRKLGFRPTHRAVAERLGHEERRIAADPAHRSSARTLARLVAHNLIYEAPGTEHGRWDRWHVRNLGLAVDRRMRTESGGDAGRHRERAVRRVAVALGRSAARIPRDGAKAFEDLALVLDLIPNLARWTASEKAGVLEVVRAKSGRDERRYLRLLRSHARLRAALIAMGSRTVR
ncbi:MAG TPA: hypothetical protein VKG23_09160 [Thermoanaerobaculia bacterium]|nr:hypothetical protein [Thermoanaerobaculia bacterium]